MDLMGKGSGTRSAYDVFQALSIVFSMLRGTLILLVRVSAVTSSGSTQYLAACVRRPR
ncbi:hypothetical protein IG631_22108 [Alternaria alternata]|nr:hypothetical protein IG631_22108 [Alternaria alternata]